MSRTTAYSYDLSGNIVQKGLGNGTKEVRTHDGRNRTSTLNNQTGGGSNVAGYAYSYDKAGNVMEIDETYPSGSLSNRTIVTTYDGVYRLLTEAITTGGSTVTTTYVYDKGHNRTSKTVSPGAVTTYVIGNGSNGAGANQIVSETTHSVATAYAYDANGNRASRKVGTSLATTGNTTSGSATVTGLASVAGVAAGMGVSGTGIPTGARVATVVSSSSVTLTANATATGTGVALTFTSYTDGYSYDDENRLIGLDYETSGSGTGTYTYAYDYRTRRVTRTELGTATHLVFNGGVSIEEYGSGGAGSPNVLYIRGHDYGGGVGGLEYSIRGSTPSYNFYDSRGDVTTKTNSSGAVTYQTGYEAFGNQTVQSGTTPLDRQRASTKEQDPTGLLNEGFRYRDPATGTFLTRDPLGFKAGPNMYTYVRQNPWTHFDPEGLTMEDLHQFWAGMGDSFISAGQGAAHAAMHPVDTAVGAASAAAHATAHPIDTATAIKNAVVSSLQSGPRGQGQVMGNVLLALAPVGTAGAVSKVASNVASKVGDIVASARSVAKPGVATVMEHAGDPVHFSVNVDAGGTSLHTHQVATPGGASTAIVPAPKTPAMPVVNSGTVNLPNAAAAQAAQKSQMAAGNLGAYNKVTNSCVSHVSSVLEAGGVKTPAPGVPGPSAQLRNLKKIVNPPPPPPPKQ